MMRYVLIILGVSFSFLVQAQLEDNIWLFGTSSKNHLNLNAYSWGNTVLDFSVDPPLVYYDSLITLDFGGSNASICTSEGELLMYSNMMSVHNRFHKGVLGADTIGYNSFWEAFNVKNYPNPGENWVVGYNTMQGVLMLPFPDKRKEYLILYNYYKIVNEILGIEDFAYTHVSFDQKPEGIGLSNDVVFHSPLIEEDKFNIGRLNACQHANGRDWWVVQFSQFNKLVYIYLLDPSGVKLHHTYENPSPNTDSHSSGQNYFSPDGSMMVSSETYEIMDPAGAMQVLLFDFDRCDGVLSLLSKDTLVQYGVNGGAAFSPSGEYLYIANHRELYQYDLRDSDLKTGRQKVGDYDGFLFKYNEFDPGTPTLLSSMAHGPDGKIYSAPESSNRYLHTIEYPDEPGLDCTLIQRSIMLNTSNHVSVPNFPHFRMGPLDGSSCDTLGKDNHPVAKYRYEQDTSDYLRVRFTDISYYRPESWSWDFGDGTTFEGKKPYYHTFAQDGVYDVCLTVSNENSTHRSDCDNRWSTQSSRCKSISQSCRESLAGHII